jgi:hypothetical protein
MERRDRTPQQEITEQQSGLPKQAEAGKKPEKPRNADQEFYDSLLGKPPVQSGKDFYKRLLGGPSVLSGKDFYKKLLG